MSLTRLTRSARLLLPTGLVLCPLCLIVSAACSEHRALPGGHQAAAAPQPHVASGTAIVGEPSRQQRFTDAATAQHITQFPIKEPSQLPTGFSPAGVIVSTDHQGNQSVLLFYVSSATTTMPPELSILESRKPSDIPPVAGNVHVTQLSTIAATAYTVPSATAEAEVLTWRFDNLTYTLTLTNYARSDPACVAECAQQQAEQELIGIARSMSTG